jgi:hypothetical protein
MRLPYVRKDQYANDPQCVEYWYPHRIPCDIDLYQHLHIKKDGCIHLENAESVQLTAHSVVIFEAVQVAPNVWSFSDLDIYCPIFTQEFACVVIRVQYKQEAKIKPEIDIELVYSNDDFIPADRFYEPCAEFAFPIHQLNRPLKSSQTYNNILVVSSGMCMMRYA